MSWDCVTLFIGLAVIFSSAVFNLVAKFSNCFESASIEHSILSILVLSSRISFNNVIGKNIKDSSAPPVVIIPFYF